MKNTSNISEQVLMFPTWVLIRFLAPILSKDHPLKNITLKDWTENSTKLSAVFSIFFWLVPLWISFIVIYSTGLIAK